MPLPGTLQPVLEYAINHPEQAAAIATGTVGAVAHYTKTGRIPLGRLPFRAGRDILQEVRAEYFGRPRPRGVPALVVDAKPADVEDALRDHHFEDTDFDYQYAGEQWSLRRPEGEKPHPETGTPTPLELHPRGFETADGRTLVVAHLEASRYEAPGDHIRETLMSWDGGRGRMATVLRNDTDLEFEKIASERQAGIDVQE